MRPCGAFGRNCMEKIDGFMGFPPIQPLPEDRFKRLISQGLSDRPDDPADMKYKSSLLDGLGEHITSLEFLVGRDLAKYKSGLDKVRADWLGPGAENLTRQEAAYRMSVLRFAVQSAVQPGDD